MLKTIRNSILCVHVLPRRHYNLDILYLTKIQKIYVFDWVLSNQPYLYSICCFVVTQWKLCDSVTIFNMAINQVLLLIGDLLIGLWQHLLNLRFKQNHVEYLYPHWTTNWMLSCYLWSPSDEIPWEHPEKRFLGVQKSFCSEISIVSVTSCWVSITKPNPLANTLPGQSGTMSDPSFPQRACSWPLPVGWHTCPASPCAQGLSQGWGCLSVP